MRDPGVEYLAAEICAARFGVVIEDALSHADTLRQEARNRLAPLRAFLDRTENILERLS
jgi:hypothetical protein